MSSKKSYNCEHCKTNYKTKSSLTKHIKNCKDNVLNNEVNNEVNNVVGKEIVIKEVVKTFNIDEYIITIKDKIQDYLKKTKYNDDILEDELLDNFIKNNPEGIKFSKRLKQLQMNAGNIWQIVIGNYNTFEDLKTGHSSGCDVKSNTRKIIIELKNRYNTDNASSRKSNLDKLVRFKKENPDWLCIYGIINDKNKKGKEEIIKHNDFEITYLSGQKLMDLIFDKDREFIIGAVKSQMLSIK